MKNLSCNLGNFRITIFFISFCIISNITAQNNFSVFIKGGLKTSFNNTFVLGNPHTSTYSSSDFYAIGLKYKFNNNRKFNILCNFNAREKTAHKYSYKPVSSRIRLEYKSAPIIIRSVGLGLSKYFKLKNNDIYFEPKFLIGHHWPVFKVTDIYRGKISYTEENYNTTYTFIEGITWWYYNSYFFETGFNIGKFTSDKISIELNFNFRQSLFNPLYNRILSYTLEVNGSGSLVPTKIGATYSGNAFYSGISINYFLGKKERKIRR